MTRRIFLLTALLASGISAHAQQPAPQPASAPVELIPVIVADGKHHGAVDLNVDIDAAGAISQTTAISGDAKLADLAGNEIKIFRYTDHSGVTGAHEHVAFLIGKEIHSVPPEYPPIARAAKVYGSVEMVAAISPDGHVGNVIALSGPPMLRGAAMDSLKKWTFPPAQSADINVPARAIVIINFAY